jgi:outer membrane protein assembly factor BamB
MRRPEAVAFLYAFERETGALRWKTATGPGVMTDLPTLGLWLYSVTLGDELLALDLDTGDRVWSFATGATNENFWMNSSPSVAGGRVFFGGLDGALYAFDARSGNLLWKRELGARISTGAIVGEGGVYVGTSDGRLYRLVPETGHVASQIETEGAPAGRLALSGECLLALIGDGVLACYSPTLDRARWTRVGSKPWSSSRAYAWQGLALAGNEGGELFAFRLTDGQIAWSETIGGTIRGIGASPEGLYVGTLKGEVHARPWPRVADRDFPQR